VPKLGLCALLAALAVLGPTGHARAETYPNRPITLIVPFPPGGSTDIVADKLAGALSQPIVVDNRAGPAARSAPAPVAGSLRALAVTSAKRSTLVPDIPAVAETLPGFDAVLLYGLVTPAGTPRPIIETLNRELRNAVNAQDVRARLATEGAEPLAGTPVEYAADIHREEMKWSQVVKASGAKDE
jgi:tripartite-type tricarboxylate transporter receptor subunit TctC